MHLIKYQDQLDKSGKEIISAEHNGMKFSIYVGKLLAGSDIIACYSPDRDSYPLMVYRHSLYGQYIEEAFQDSRRFNPTAYTPNT
jgi:hypothetical protein